jgi:hypothetical protein
LLDCEKFVVGCNKKLKNLFAFANENCFEMYFFGGNSNQEHATKKTNFGLSNFQKNNKIIE